MRHKIFVPILDQGAASEDAHWVPIAGVPCWHQCLRNLGEFDVFVDTNSEEIRDSIRAAHDLSHVTVYLRETTLMAEATTVNDLIRAFLDRYGIHHEVVGQCHANSPFLKAGSLLRAFESFSVESNVDSVIAVTEFQGRFWRDDRGEPIPVNHNPMVLKRSEHLEPCYVENSAFYVFNAATFRALGNRVGMHPVFQSVEFPENIRFRSRDDFMRFRARVAGMEL